MTTVNAKNDRKTVGGTSKPRRCRWTKFLEKKRTDDPIWLHPIQKMIVNTAKIKMEVMRFLSVVVSGFGVGLAELDMGCALVVSIFL